MDFINDPHCKAYANALVDKNINEIAKFEPDDTKACPGQWVLWICCILHNVVDNLVLPREDRLQAAMFIYHFYDVRDYDDHVLKSLRLGTCAKLVKQGLPFEYNIHTDTNPDYNEVVKGVEFVLLEQHNEKRRWLGKDMVDEIPSSDECLQIDQEYQLWLYRPGGDKYLECQKIIDNLV